MRPGLRACNSAQRQRVRVLAAHGLDPLGQAGEGPHLGAGTGFDRSEFHLYPVGVETWGGFVFLNLPSATAQPFAAQLGGIPGRLQRDPLCDLRSGATIEYQVAASWKIICENLQRVPSLRRYATHVPDEPV